MQQLGFIDEAAKNEGTGNFRHPGSLEKEVRDWGTDISGKATRN